MLGDGEHAGWVEVPAESVGSSGMFDGPAELADKEQFKFLLRIMRAMYGGFFVPLHPVDGDVCVDATCRAVTDWELRLMLGREPAGVERDSGAIAREAVQENITVEGVTRAYPARLSGSELLGYAKDVVEMAVGSAVMVDGGNLRLRFWRQVLDDDGKAEDTDYWGMCDDCVMMELPDITDRFVDPLLALAFAKDTCGPLPEFIPPVPGVVSEDDRSWLVFDELSCRMLEAVGVSAEDGDSERELFVASLSVVGARDDMPFRVLGARLAVPGIYGYAPGTFPVRVGDVLHGVPFAGFSNDGVSRRMLSIVRDELVWDEGTVSSETVGLTRVEGTIALRCGCPLVVGALGRSSVTYVEDIEWLEDDEGTGLAFGSVFSSGFERLSDREECGITPVDNGLGEVLVGAVVEGSYLLVNGLTRVVFRVLDVVVPLVCGDVMHGLAGGTLETSMGEGLHVRVYCPDDGRDVVEGDRIAVNGVLCFEVYDAVDEESGVQMLRDMFDEDNDEE